jgi:hypothetical protein
VCSLYTGEIVHGLCHWHDSGHWASSPVRAKSLLVVKLFMVCHWHDATTDWLQRGTPEENGRGRASMPRPNCALSSTIHRNDWKPFIFQRWPQQFLSIERQHWGSIASPGPGGIHSMRNIQCRFHFSLFIPTDTNDQSLQAIASDKIQVCVDHRNFSHVLGQRVKKPRQVTFTLSWRSGMCT